MPPKTKILVALSPELPEYLQNSVIFINNHSEKGALGFILNKPCSFQVAQEVINDIGAGRINKVYTGGPVKQNVGYIIHTSDYYNANTFKLTEDVYVTTGTQILDDMAANMEPEDFMMVLGHCTWGPGELENEVAAGYWAVTQVQDEYFFAGRKLSEQLWDEAIHNIAVERTEFLFKELVITKSPH